MGLNVTSQELAQVFNLERSLLILLNATIGSDTASRREVSSANRKMLDSMSSMYKIKSKGPNIEPYGTPAVIVDH